MRAKTVHIKSSPSNFLHNSSGRPFSLSQSLTSTDNELVPNDGGYRRSNALFLLQLKEGKGLSQVAVDTVVEGCERIVDESVQQARKDVLEELKKADLGSIIPTLESVFQSQTAPFESLRNKYQQEKYYEQELKMTVSV